MFLFSCQSTPDSTQTLYQELGGVKAVTNVVERMIIRLHQDPKLSPLFREANDVELTKNLSDFICNVAGGHCDYEGAEMIDIHSELAITKGEFDHFVSLFIFSMDEVGVPFTAQNRLLVLLANMRPDIIEL